MSDNKESWKCPACGNEEIHNFCRECGTLRPDNVNGTTTVQGTSDTKAAPSVSGNIWKCNICGHENSGQFCSECGQNKDNNEKILDHGLLAFQAFPPMQIYTEPARGLLCDTQMVKPIDPKCAEPWVCTNCEHTNKGGEYCFNCGKPNPVLQKDKDWICSDCGTTVKDGAPFCQECGKKNPSLTNRQAAAMNGNDPKEPWKCNRCGFENTSGLYCVKCDASKLNNNGVFGQILGASQQTPAMVSTQPAFGLADPPDFVMLAEMRRFTNKSLKSDSSLCGCYTCCKQFDSSEITVWNDDFAVCPYCQSDTVVAKPKKDTDFGELLDKMNRFHIKLETVDGCRSARCKIEDVDK